MVHGILQFTPSIAFHNVVHRWESRDIHCRVDYHKKKARHRHRGYEGVLWYSISLALRAPGSMASRVGRERVDGWEVPRAQIFCHCQRRSAGAGFDNDPSAGSPTETLLRLLLPLNDKVQWTSRDVASGEPPTSPRSEHFTGPFNRTVFDRLRLNWPGRASGVVTLKKLECSKQAYALDTLAWDNIIGFRSSCVGLRDRSND
ncbi:hypothetical protein SADUNF_Sadunf11G0071100 [Salix dunnii]|uniref:Uncharacterized protein n=1 Tax=Salix dunnii TaxID=1413687 RepID=A0A835JTH1_9ROSI|nr:hypothetical protein SADUNF_Sadunf11G0071100 [Salix dunnii]